MTDEEGSTVEVKVSTGEEIVKIRRVWEEKVLRLEQKNESLLNQMKEMEKYTKSLQDMLDLFVK